MDKEVLAAFEQRYVNLSLNAAGFGNNALNATQNSKYSDARI